ncbi:unnamed protein product [Porites lobata]|uniref:Uncharacterized protein n=1 Tax=Porites lobata TaxID=104759 RepID=A0ABN8QJR1_9CNID|nr:unnamed protein product [Porites lobata]
MSFAHKVVLWVMQRRGYLTLLDEKQISWITKNEKFTRKFCNSLLIQLKEKHLNPVRRRLERNEAAKISFHQIIGGYNQIQEDYHNSAKGAKDVITAVFTECCPALLKELEQSLVAKALQEQENQRLESSGSKVHKSRISGLLVHLEGNERYIFKHSSARMCGNESQPGLQLVEKLAMPLALLPFNATTGCDCTSFICADTIASADRFICPLEQLDFARSLLFAKFNNPEKLRAICDAFK